MEIIVFGIGGTQKMKNEKKNKIKRKKRNLISLHVEHLYEPSYLQIRLFGKIAKT